MKKMIALLLVFTLGSVAQLTTVYAMSAVESNCMSNGDDKTCKSTASETEDAASGASTENPLHIRKKSGLAFSGYSGGMMVHTGYVTSREVNFYSAAGNSVAAMRIKGMPIGIGGALRVHFGKYLRVGTEGYSSNLKYGKNGSYEHVGWGGLLVDGVLPIGRLLPFVGLTFGGGGVKNVTVIEDTSGDFVLDEGTTSYRRYAFMALAPFAGVEYALTDRVHLVLKADCLLNVSSPSDDFVIGPRVYFGFMFCH